jgi:hypothetical protein
MFGPTRAEQLAVVAERKEADNNTQEYSKATYGLNEGSPSVSYGPQICVIGGLASINKDGWRPDQNRDEYG